MKNNTVNAAVAAAAVPMTQELQGEQLDTLMGGVQAKCGSGWWHTLTAECTCTTGMSRCWGEETGAC